MNLGKVLAIARANLLRTTRDRLGLFFILVLPMILIVVLGLTYGGFNSARIGIADADGGPLATEVVDGIELGGIDLAIRSYGDPDDLRDAVRRGFVEVGLVIPAGYDATLRAGGEAPLEVVAQASSLASAVRSAVDESISHQATLLRAARFAMDAAGLDFDAALATARSQESAAPGVAVAVDSVSESAAGPSGFTIGAQSQVILFVFLTSLTGATELILTRQLGISRRMFATPTGAWTIIAGEGLGRVGFALFQGFFIVVVSALAFGVDWVDPLATSAIVVAFGLVAAGAAMLIGALAANASQAGAIGPALGMMLGLLGGTMVPADVFPAVMRTASHITPHAWAMDAFREMLLDGAGLLQIVPQLGVLLGFAAVLFAVAVFRFRRVVTGGGS
jgi:linearmycin/streptolysin S transport system permease protein